MVIFPNCKINLGLRVVRKRTDGYHDLQTIFYPLPLHDVLEIVDTPNDSTTIHTKGLPIKGPVEKNLCLRAYQLLKKDFPSLPPVSIHLYKNIPMGAGLGGGSSNGAACLQLLNQKFQLGIPENDLIRYALELGSDCPFFILNKPCYAEGRGEQMELIRLDLSAYEFLLVNPGIHVSTATAFGEIEPALPDSNLKDLVQQPIQNWKNQIINDFEAPVFKKHPELAQIKSKLYDSGALYASMTGTGSTVYGVFERGAAPKGVFGGKGLEFRV